MTPVKIRIEFGVHVKRDLILHHLTDWGCEVVSNGDSDRIFTVVVSRTSRLGRIEHELANWQLKGDLTWSEEGPIG